MPTFNMAAQTPNGNPGGTEAAVYTNGIQTYPGRKLSKIKVNDSIKKQQLNRFDNKQYLSKAKYNCLEQN